MSSDSLINVVIPPLAQPFTYSLPTEWGETVKVGYQVDVPFGNRTATGFVVSKYGHQELQPAEDDFEIKFVSGIPVDGRCFLPEQLEFFSWVADYYQSPLSTVLDVAVPQKVSPKKVKRSLGR